MPGSESTLSVVEANFARTDKFCQELTYLRGVCWRFQMVWTATYYKKYISTLPTNCQRIQGQHGISAKAVSSRHLECLPSAGAERSASKTPAQCWLPSSVGRHCRRGRLSRYECDLFRGDHLLFV